MPNKMPFKIEPPHEDTLEISLEEEYTPHRALEIPPMPDDDQYIYRWIRFRAGAEDDYNNISARLREGWTFVNREDVPANYVFPGLQSKMDALVGAATNGDLVLAKLPRRKGEAMQRYAEQRAYEAEQAYNLKMVRSEDGIMLTNEGSRSISRGRRPSFG